MNIRHWITLVEGAVGECFTYAFKNYLERQAKGEPVTLVHANVTHPWDKTTYPHAWVEDNDRVYDWQTMVAGSSKYRGVGWPKDVYYEDWKPTNIRRFSGPEVGKLYGRYRHCGPWNPKSGR